MHKMGIRGEHKGKLTSAQGEQKRKDLGTWWDIKHMERALKYEDLIFLNRLQARRQIRSLAAFRPLYAAAQDGIYKIIRRKSWKIVFSLSGKGKEVIGEKVADWSEVQRIIITNVRQENVANSLVELYNILYPQFKDIGDWHVILKDGREIVIEGVPDPYNTLEYVKAKFNLQI